MNRARLWSALGAGLVALPAAAAPPAIVDDAGALAQGECEAVIGAERSRTSASGDSLGARALGLEAACGLGHGLQLGLGVSRAWTGDARAEALGASAKFRLVGDDEAGTALTLLAAAASERSRPDGGRSRGWELGLALSQALGEGWTLHANLLRSHARAEGEASRTTAWGLGLERALGERGSAFVEWAGESGGERVLGAGLRWSVADWTLGTALHRSQAEPRTTVLSLSAVRGF